MNTENQPIDLVSAALVECQGQLEAATFDAQNPFLKNKYASLGAVIFQSRPILAKNGLAILQTPSTLENHVSLTTTILHKSGQKLDCGTITLPIGDEKGKSLAQIVGSLITYMRRYAWSSVLGMYAEEDTDGNDGPKTLTGAIPRRATQAPATFTRPTPQNAPVSPPSTTNALPVATDKHRMKALHNLGGAPGEKNRVLVTHYLMSKGWIGGTQEPEAWPLEHVPATPEQMTAVIEEVTAFEGRQREVTP